LGGFASHFVGGAALVVVTEVVLLALGLQIVVGPGESLERTGGEVARWRVGAVAIGAGFAGGLLANAGGFLLAPLRHGPARRALKVACATSLAAEAVLALPGTVAHALVGHVDWTLTALFAAASISLASLGAHVALHTRTECLERRYGAFLIASSLALLVLDL
jgi:uncharacterized protein